MSGTFKASSAIVNDAGSGMTVAWPAGHKAGDFGLLVSSVSGTVTTSIPSTPSGWTLIGSTEANSSSVFNRITVWYLVATSGAMAAAVVPSGGFGGNTGCSIIHTYAGCANLAPDVSLLTPQTATNSISSAGVTTTTANDLLIAIASQHSSSAAAGESISGWTCAALVNFAEYSDLAVSSNLGGQAIGLGMACGMKRAAGATGTVTATWGSSGSFLNGGMLVVALKPATTTAVTQDATDGRWYASTEAEYCSLYHGDALPTPGEMWLMQEASGSLIDVFGNQNLTAFNAPQYHQTKAGTSRFAIGYTGVNDCHYAASAPSDGLGNINTVSSMVFGCVAYSGTPTTAKNLINLEGGPGDRHLQLNTTPRYQIIGLGQATGTGTANPGTAIRPVIFQVDRANAAIVFQDDQETLSPTYTAPSGGSAYFSIGPDSVGDSSIQELWFLCLAWADRKAEFSASMRATLIDRHLNGPAVVSIAVTPGSATIAPLGTQAMVATSTRGDGSTVVNTGSCTWSSASPSIATVNASTGVVTGVAAGTAVITCTFTSLNSATITSNGATITVTGGVSTPTVTKITVTPASPTIIAGQNKQASAVVTYSDTSTADITTTAKWSTTSASIASVTSKGLIHAVSTGATGLTATPGIVAYPITAAAMAAAVGYGTWGAGWLCDETSGSLVPAFGAPSLAAVGTPTYNKAGPLGAGDYSVGFSTTANDAFDGGNVFDAAANDLCFAWVANFATSTPNCDVLIKSNGTAGYELRLIGGLYRIDLSDSSSHSLFLQQTTPITFGAWHVGMFVIDRAAGTCRIATINLDGTNPVTTAALSLGSVGTTLTTSHMFIGSGLSAGVGSGAPTTLSLAAFWINTGASVASTMSANLATAVANLGQALMGSALVTTAPYLSSIDHIAAALSRLPSQFQKTKIQNLIRSFAYPAQELEQAMWAVLTQRSITNAIGAQLDVIGGIVGQDRNGMNDDDYRRYISARVAAERSQGVLEDLYSIAVLIVNDPTITFSGIKEPPATLRFTVDGGITDQLAAILYVFLHLAVGAGVRLIVQWSNVPDVATFTLDIGPGLDSGNLSSSVG